MAMLKWALLVGLIFWAAVGPHALRGQVVDLKKANEQKMEMAYNWGHDKFQQENEEIERTYLAAIRAAQIKRAEDIRLTRVRYLQGLKFLNSNPSLPQKMRVIINEEMKRVSERPDPDPPPVDDSAPKQLANDAKQKIKIHLRIVAPDKGWTVRILQAKKVNGEIWALSSLQHGSEISEMVATPVSDLAFVESLPDLPIRHFVLNKTWETVPGDVNENVKFIDGVPDLGREWVLGELLTIRREAQ